MVTYLLYIYKISMVISLLWLTNQHDIKTINDNLSTDLLVLFFFKFKLHGIMVDTIYWAFFMNGSTWTWAEWKITDYIIKLISFNFFSHEHSNNRCPKILNFIIFLNTRVIKLKLGTVLKFKEDLKDLNSLKSQVYASPKRCKFQKQIKKI